ncbi:VirB4 family type IV secretion system protein [Bacillus sp. FJAT-28004]|uniref:VirB4 family type IV secretion system protein n=1 Tax=Bacillus sp. FJAT-28004 TaxID=1679165 RepID=UPI0006B503DD|nr:DUF87 domain-containing protein [Bacillus sp. FJAT-28004]
MSEVKKKKVRKKTASTPVSTGLLDILSPSALDFKPKTITNGEMYQRVVTIINFPNRVGPGWISQVATLPGVVASIHATPTDPVELANQIRISVGEMEGKLNQGGNGVNMSRVAQQYKDAIYLINKIDNESQAVFFVTVVFLVTATDMDMLQERCKKLEAKLSGAGMRGRTPMFRQEEGLKSVGPYRILAPEIAEIGARNMPVETIAASYPFVYSGINDGDGILLGSDKDGGILLVDFWQRDGSRTNSNVTVLGKPGVGKSTVIKKCLSFEHANDTDVIIIDPEREYKDLTHRLQGDWINCGAGGDKGRINPLQIRNVPLDDEEDTEEALFTKEMKSQGPLALHFQILRTFFRLYCGKDLTKLKLSYLELALEDVFKKKDIIWQTDPNQLKNADYPFMEDIFYWLEEMSKKESTKAVWEELMMLIRPAAVGADSGLWNGPTTLTGDSDFICLDTHNLLDAAKEIQQAQYFNILGWSWNKIASDRTRKTILAGDEFYLNVDPDNPETLKFTRNASKRIRKYEGGLWVITHDMNDFMDPAVRRYGQSLLSNPTYKIIMGQGEQEIKSLTELMHLSEKEIETLMAGNRGEALFFAGSKRVHASIEVSNEELALFGKGGGR